jgi:myo-inositol-1(or 4)-monophosphatase
MNVGIAAAREAGQLLLSAAADKLSIHVKADKSLVTTLDKEAERIIRGSITAAFPSHSILGEEGGWTDEGAEYTWIIDPLDGTHNYIRRIPLYGVSIGIVRGKEFVAGVIYLPAQDEMFCAEAGGGATKNGERISVSEVSTLEACSLSFDSGIRPDAMRRAGVLGHMASRIFNLRMFGASTINLTSVAQGRLDGAVEFDDYPWDFAAAVTIIREAGGCITSFTGEPITHHTRGYIAGNSLIHRALLDLANQTPATGP